MGGGAGLVEARAERGQLGGSVEGEAGEIDGGEVRDAAGLVGGRQARRVVDAGGELFVNFLVEPAWREGEKRGHDRR